MSEVRIKRNVSKEIEETFQLPEGNEFFISARHPHCSTTVVWFAKMKNGCNWVYVKFSEQFNKTDFSFEVCDYTHRNRLLNIEEFLKWCNCSGEEVHFINKPVFMTVYKELMEKFTLQKELFYGNCDKPMQWQYKLDQ
jgi:hypothetical protein